MCLRCAIGEVIDTLGLFELIAIELRNIEHIHRK
jgi:hypothetical protein